jgi:hypothetical protein
MEELIDFGQGFFSGGMAGAKMSGGNPLVTGASALGLGTISYFGGESQRRLEKKNNALQVRGMQQDLELGEMNLSAARRADKEERERKARQATFGKLLGQYFARKQGVK